MLNRQHGLPNVKALCDSRFVASIIHNPANIVKSRNIPAMLGRGRWGKTSGATGETLRLSCGGMWEYMYKFPLISMLTLLVILVIAVWQMVYRRGDSVGQS